MSGTQLINWVDQFQCLRKLNKMGTEHQFT